MIQADIVEYDFSKEINELFETGVFGYITNSNRLIETISRTLAPGGRFAIFDGKQPEQLPSWVFDLIVWVSRPFGVTDDHFNKRTWEYVERHFQEATFEQMYGCMMHILSGTVPTNSS